MNYIGETMQGIETTKMSTKGQVIIPKGVREFTGSEKETIFTVFPIDRETIVLKKLNAEKLVAEFRALRKTVKNKISEKKVNELVHKVR